MKKLLLILLCLPMIGFGQSWELELDSLSVRGYNAEQTIDNGYIIAGGVSDDYDENNSFLLKLDSQGDTIFLNISTYIFEDNATCVRQTLDSGYIITGLRTNLIDTSLSPYLIKTDSQGDTMWVHNLDWLPAYASSVQQTNDGGYMIYCGSLFPNNFSILIKTDFQGDTIFTKSFEGILPFIGDPIGLTNKSFQQTYDNGYISLLNYWDTSANNCSNSFSVIKSNILADTVWVKTFTKDSSLVCQNIQQTVDSGYILSAISHFNTTIQTPTNVFDHPYLIKLNKIGDTLWTKDYSWLFTRSVRVEKTFSGDYILACVAWDPLCQYSEAENAYLIKIDSQGDTLWSKNILDLSSSNLDSRGESYAVSVKQTIDGGYFIVLVIELDSPIKESGKYSTFLIKTDDNGDVTSTFNIPKINTSKGKLLKIVDLLGRETKQTNQPLLYLYDDGTVEKRIVIE